MIEKIFVYAGHLMAACMDLAVGALLVSVISYASGVEVPLWLYAAGAFFAIIPDMDLAFDALKAKDLSGWDHHQTLTHRPIIMLPLVAAVGGSVGYFYGEIILYAGTFFLCTLWHFIHDTKEFGGGGIAWFWPYSRKYWSITSFELPEDSVMGKESSFPKWIHPTYLSMREVCITVIAATAASFIDSRLALYGAVLIPLFCVCVLLTWTTSSRFGPKEAQ